MSDDQKALAAILDCLRYVEREIALLNDPIPEALTATVRAKAHVEGALNRPAKRRGSRRR